MQSAIKLPEGGVVRIRQDVWDDIQKISLELSVQIGRPVKESIIVMHLLNEAVNQVKEEKLKIKLDDTTKT